MLELNRKVNRKLFTFFHNSESGNHHSGIYQSGNHHSGRIRSVVSHALLENEKQDLVSI